ncbi:MAG: sulfatase-like hydrolase/transferase [Pirellulaceae bacterium]|nr:sulfatase-like hydrolase/transferase [Pirellulaceae bacterium]
MQRRRKLLITVLASFVTLLGILPCMADRARPNILFIAVDDLRPELGCYGDSHVHSPNIDALAASGRLFQRAYCQQAVCNPSRTSLMTGMRPDWTGVTGNHSHFRDDHPDVVTLPQHFKQHGYHAAAIGKIYHGVFPEGASITKWDTMGDPSSWSVPAIRFGPRYYYTEAGIAAAKQVYQRVYQPADPASDDWTQKLVFGPATESPDVFDNTLYDGQVADTAVATLRRLATTDEPFFLAVGFIKPHSPYVAPQKYFDLYDDVSLPAISEFPSGAPSIAGHASGELRRYTDQPKRGAIPLENQRRVRHAYLACISFIDAQIGRVLQAVQSAGLSENTIVVLYGDHGYHLGEQGLWGKTTNFELDTRVPLIVRVPGMSAAGQATSSLVELVDLYPTLAELAGLPISQQLHGKSFGSVLRDPQSRTKTMALSQYPRSGDVMGYSIRTQTQRLTQWVHRPSGLIRATELYDYADTPIETVNIAAESPATVGRLSNLLMKGFDMRFTATPAAKTSVDATTDADQVSVTSFESAKPGPFERIATPVGTWVSVSGNSIVDDRHSKTGKHCLQLCGGDLSSVTLQIAKGIETTGDLTFWAERWTKRAPFSFRIEKRVGDKWQEVYRGDDQIRVGRSFLSTVKIHLGDDSITELRWTATSPADTGILIDDVRIASAKSQEIVSAVDVPMTLPALIGVDASPLSKLKIETSGQLNPISLTHVEGNLQGTVQQQNIDSLSIYLGAGNFADSKQIARIESQLLDDGRFVFSIPPDTCRLAEGDNFVWIAASINAGADIDQTIGAACRQVTFSNDAAINIPSTLATQRMGVAVRDGGDDGINTFRIPGLATTNEGTLIGVYDVRHRAGGDLPGDIDVGMSRSTDGGRTWEPMQIIMDMGQDPKWLYDGIGDPAILVDKNTGTVWVAATWSHGNRSWVGSGPGLTPDETGQLMMVRSDDDGVTWSAPINITSQVKKPEWCFLLQGPGKGITMRDGTIVFAAQYQDPPNQNRLPHSTILYSKDHGASWQIGSGAADDTTEAQVVEVEPGVLMLNCRYNRSSARVVMTTRDMGQTWQTHPTSKRSLIEPGSCMASLIKIDRGVGNDDDSWLLFSNPDSTRGRHHITIKASPDRGMTWPKQHRLLLDEGLGRGYSCLSIIDDKTVGILYEGSRADMTFQRIALSDLISDGKQAISSRNQRRFETVPKRLRLPPVFGSHMVLQADAEIPVWGWARPGATVTVTLGSDTQIATTDQKGKWSIRLPARTANASPSEMRIQSEDQQIRLADVLIGEVWVCAGQSNMQWPLGQSTNDAKELDRLARNDRPTALESEQATLRLLHLTAGARGSSGSYTPDHIARLTADDYCRGEWEIASVESARAFSAVAWYFGRHLQRELNVPVGLICPAVGGTPTEAWIPRHALAAEPDLHGLVAGNWLDNELLGDFCRTRGQQNLLAAIRAGETVPGDEVGPNHSFKPGFMWSAGIEPLIPYAIRGVIWYQGESNAETAARVHQHGRLFPLLIQQWRQSWGQNEFPFLYVQLPALNRPEWPWFREQQRRMLDQVNDVGMAISIDTGHPTNVHPPLKKPIGERLATWALGTTYHSKSHTTYSGPLLDTVQRDENSLTLSFKHVGGGLKSSDDRPLRHFEVCGDNSVFHVATATVTAKNKVTVSSDSVASPRHVRYAWQPFPNPPVNLVNDRGLPASPFSTEQASALIAQRETAVPATTEPDTTAHDASDHAGRPNILLIVGEDHGCELSCYGDGVIQTPNIDALASQGVLFENGYVTQSVCSPSRSTIFTGLYPHQNGQLGLATHQYGWFKRWPTTYSLLKQAGYRTGLIGKTHVIPADAVESFVDYRYQESSNFAKRNVAEYAKKAREFFDSGDEPFFMTVNYPDAHWPLQGSVDGLPTTRVDPGRVLVMPYVGGQTPRMLQIAQNYYDCMLRLDECVGQLLSELDDCGKSDNTLVVFIGDHGAQMARGKVTVYEGGMRVPYLVRWPGVTTAQRRSTALVSTIDLLPTFMDAAKCSTPAGLPGKSLRPVLWGHGDESFRQYLACERNCDAAQHTFPQRTIRDARYKLIHSPIRDREDPAARYYRNHGATHWSGCLTDAELAEASEQTRQGYARWLHPPEYQLYDLRFDPHEWTDLADDPNHARIKQRLREALARWQSDTSDPIAETAKLQMLMDENDKVVKAKRRSPKAGWRYLQYLAPRNLDSLPQLESSER